MVGRSPGARNAGPRRGCGGVSVEGTKFNFCWAIGLAALRFFGLHVVGAALSPHLVLSVYVTTSSMDLAFWKCPLPLPVRSLVGTVDAHHEKHWHGWVVAAGAAGVWAGGSSGKHASWIKLI